MKNLMRIFALAAIAALLLCACVDDTLAGDPDSSNASVSGTTQPSSEPSVPPTDSEPVDDGKVTYTVTVVDQDGNGVANVAVQFCDESGTCQLPVRTGENGVVTKSLEPATYHVTLTLPEGYSCDTLEYNMDGITELTVTVTAQ